jgi:hypothetical protein
MGYLFKYSLNERFEIERVKCLEDFIIINTGGDKFGGTSYSGTYDNSYGKHQRYG